MADLGNNSITCTNISQINGNGSCPEKEPFKYYYEYDEYQTYLFIAKNSIYVTTYPAIPLNVMCIAVVALMRPFNSSCLYMFILGWADLVCVLCRLMYDHVDIASSDFVCKLNKYLGTSSLVYSNYVLVCFTLERLFVTSFPLKASQVCNKRNTGISLVVSLVLCLCLNAIYIKESFVKVTIRGGVVIATCTHTPLIGNKWVKVFGMYHNIVPLSVIALSNIGIIYNLNNQRKKKRKMTNRTTPSAQNDPTRTLVVVSMVFIVLHLPKAVFNLAVPDYPTPAELPFFDQQLMARLLLTGNICYGIMCLQNGVNFFMYFFTAAKFRRSFKKILTPFSRCFVRARDTTHVPATHRAITANGGQASQNSTFVSSITGSTMGINNNQADVT